MYGVTETTVPVTYRPISRADVESGAGSMLGVPIPDSSSTWSTAPCNLSRSAYRETASAAPASPAGT